MPSQKIPVTALKSVNTLEGAGVRLKRAFGYRQIPLFDPFLMLDDFHSSNPADYMAGFPWHPHRGIETITYILEGIVEHGDNMGNRGEIGAGEVQWMTAGSGIIHQEMPRKSPTGTMWGFQFWANLPSGQKMMDPRYRGIAAGEIPEVSLSEGVKVKIICGEAAGVKGPVKDIVIEPELMDVTISAGREFNHSVKEGHMAAIYVLTGKAGLSDGSEHGKETVALFSRNGDSVKVAAPNEQTRFLFFSGKPLEEPIAWGGPIVMNTQEELDLAFTEYQKGAFIKAKV